MALIVEDGTGVTGAESYCSVSAADTYHSNFGNTAWALLTTGEKETALRQATWYLDLKYGAMWRGTRVDVDQALDWPRYGGITDDGYAIDDDEIPVHLLRGVAEAALRASAEDLIPDIANPGYLKQKIERVGPVMRSQTWDGGGQSQLKSYSEVWLHVSRLVNPISMERS